MHMYKRTEIGLSIFHFFPFQVFDFFFPTSITIILFSVIFTVCMILSSLSNSFPIYLSIRFLSSYLPIYLCIHLSIYLSIYQLIYSSIYLSFCPPIHLSIYQCIYLSIYLSNLSVATILCRFCSLQLSRAFIIIYSFNPTVPISPLL